ncbi:MAG: radical SAM protein [Bacteroidales bacterium]
MSTFLFDRIVFGPVKSRRLGSSLGINLLPEGKKICNFNCIYCECGWNSNDTGHLQWPSIEQVEKQLVDTIQQLIQQGKSIDTITFAGNGEPTMHPLFPDITGKVIEIRNRLLPSAKIAVLSNATLISKPSVQQALGQIDMNILKLDSAIESTCRLLNQPTGYFNLQDTIEQLKQFGNRCIIQTMFVRGYFNQQAFDNTTPEELEAWLQAIKKISPAYVMIYSIARDTPAEQIYKVSAEELRRIADMAKRAGIKVSVST